MTEYERRYANFLYKFSKSIKEIKLNNYSKIVFLCIGTSDIVGDSFGPLVGKKLKEKIKNEKILILGDLQDNISALNIEKRVDNIKEKCDNPLIIAIDAALSRKEDIGKIKIYPYGMRVRRALEENENKIGNLSIKAIVANDNKEAIVNYQELKKTPFSRIDYLSQITADGINTVINNGNV